MFALDYMAHADRIFMDGRFHWEKGTPSQTRHIEWSLCTAAGSPTQRDPRGVHMQVG